MQVDPARIQDRTGTSDMIDNRIFLQELMAFKTGCHGKNELTESDKKIFGGGDLNDAGSVVSACRVHFPCS